MMQYTSKEVYEYISHETNDPIVERKNCAVSGQPFAIFQSDLDFYNKISPTFDGRKFQIPAPTLCPEERQRRRLIFRNERKLYKRTCDYSGKDIISIYSPDKPYKVYDQKIWRSDARDPMNYGMDFDFTKTFTENFGELMIQVPRISVLNGYNENSEYTNHGWKSKNAYMCSGFGGLYNCMYCNDVEELEDCIDILSTFYSDNSYQLLDSQNVHNSMYIINSQNISYSQYIYNCQNIQNSLFCFNKVNCNGYLLNQFIGKDKVRAIINNKYEFEKYKIEFLNLISKGIKKGLHILNSECSLGNNIINSKNTILSFKSEGCNNVKYSYELRNSTNCFDTYVRGENPSNTYEGHCITGNNILFSNVIWGGRDMLFSDNILGASNNLFGCVGLRNKQYCIFNKQYTKDKYEKTVANIITHMQETGERGEFFHPSLSPFGYNETVAQEYFPLSKEATLAQGYRWSDYSSDPKIPAGATILTGDQIPSDIATVTDDIIKQVIICEISKRPFMIQKAELEFYRKHNLPIPRRHPDVRHEERMKLRPGRTLYLRNCDQCNTTMLSVYDKEYDGKVYCEHCYQKEVFA